MRRGSVMVAITVLALAAFTAARLAQPARAIVTYGPGWNLVGGPEGSYLGGAAGSIYTLQPGDTDYEIFPATSPLHAGWGYWAFFPTGGSITFGVGQANYSVTPVPGQWIMVGNPGASGPARILGADVQSVPVLQVGQGGFVMSARTVMMNVPTETVPAISGTAPKATPPPPCSTATFGQFGQNAAGSRCTTTSQTSPTARCYDGSFDYSGAVTACAGHGGVAYWAPGPEGERVDSSDPNGPVHPAPPPSATPTASPAAATTTAGTGGTSAGAGGQATPTP
jgi:hypothetical protein